LAVYQANDDIKDDGEDDADENHADDGYEAGEALTLDADVTGEVAEVGKEGNARYQHEQSTEDGQDDANDQDNATE
jgi:hypothetical protein